MDNGSNKVAISNDGTKISVAYTNGYVYYSSNSGSTFQIVSPAGPTGTSLATQNVAKNYWGLGMSKDGTKLVTAVNNGSLVPNINAISWTTNPGAGLTAGDFYYNAMSSTGQYILLTQQTFGTINVSSNYGANWFVPSTAGLPQYSFPSISATGQYMVYSVAAGSPNGAIYLSSVYGQTWTKNPGNLTSRVYIGTAISANGQFILTSVQSGNLYLSTNYGTWFTSISSVTISANGGSLAMSSAGQYMISTNSTGTNPFVSSDYGSNWTAKSAVTIANLSGQCTAVSGSGQYMLYATNLASAQGFLLSSNYGASFNLTSYTTTSVNAVSISYTGQFMIASRGNNAAVAMSSNYGTNWSTVLTVSNSPAFGNSCISSNAQYVLCTTSSNAVAGNVYLATFPYSISVSTTINLTGRTWTTKPGTGLPTTGNWNAFSMSFNGQYQLVPSRGGYVYISTNYGNNWATPSTLNLGATWASSSVSGTGQYMAVNNISGSNYISSNYGTTFKSLSTGNITISYTGQYMVLIYATASFSADYGKTWTASTGVTSPGDTCAISGNGQYVIGTKFGNSSICLSSTYGASFYTIPGISTVDGGYPSISYTGQYILVSFLQLSTGAFAYLSTSYGIYWSPVVTTTTVVASSISYTGQFMAIAMGGTNQSLSAVGATGTGSLYFSSSYGKFWTLNPGGLSSGLGYAAIAISGNAKYFLTGLYTGAIYSFINNSNNSSNIYNTDYWLQQNQIGQNWVTNPGGLGALYLRSCALSANGQYILMVSDSASGTYVSSNYGNNWTTIGSIVMFTCAMSYSGQYMVAGPLGNNYPYMSSNYGINWFTNAVFPLPGGYPNGGYLCAKISGNAQYILFAAQATNGSSNNGSVYLSSDSGKNWKVNPGTGLPASAGYNMGGISYTGQYMFVTGYLSTNYGNNWTANISLNSSGINNGNMSGNGQVIFVSNNGTSTSISSNYGQSFLQ